MPKSVVTVSWTDALASSRRNNTASLEPGDDCQDAQAAQTSRAATAPADLELEEDQIITISEEIVESTSSPINAPANCPADVNPGSLASAADLYRLAAIRNRVAREFKELLYISVLILIFLIACIPGLLLRTHRSFISSHPESLKASLLLVSGSITLPVLGCLVLPLILYARDQDLRSWTKRAVKRVFDKNRVSLVGQV